MAEHRSHLTWKRTTPDFTLDTYNRDYDVTFSGGETIEGSASRKYGGNTKLVNPEELLIAAVSSCYMLTLLALAVKFGLIVNEYEDQAEGTLGKNQEGHFYVNEIILRPKISFDPKKSPDPKTFQDLLQKAHAHCFISNTVCSNVRIEPIT